MDDLRNESRGDFQFDYRPLLVVSGHAVGRQAKQGRLQRKIRRCSAGVVGMARRRHFFLLSAHRHCRLRHSKDKRRRVVVPEAIPRNKQAEECFPMRGGPPRIEKPPGLCVAEAGPANMILSSAKLPSDHTRAPRLSDLQLGFRGV